MNGTLNRVLDPIQHLQKDEIFVWKSFVFDKTKNLKKQLHKKCKYVNIT